MKKLRTLVLVLLLLGGITALAWQDLEIFYKEISFYWYPRTETELKVKAFAEENDLLYGQYPESLIQLLERNPETEEFVLNYPLRGESSRELTQAEASRESVPLFLQWDSRWGYETYGSDVIAITGCGPTCLAMAGYYVTGDARFNPIQLADFAWKGGYYSPGNGSSWTLISEGGVKLGLDVTEIPLVKKRIVDNLKVDNPIILALGPGDFTTSGHYVVLTGVEGGLFRVNDPNSRERSARLWSYEELAPQIRNLWVIR